MSIRFDRPSALDAGVLIGTLAGAVLLRIGWWLAGGDDPCEDWGDET